MAWVVVAVLFLGCGFLAVLRWQLVELKQQVSQIDKEPGVLVTELELSGFSKIKLKVLRDPSAISVKEWLIQHNLPLDQIIYTQRAYLSLEPSLIKSKTQDILQAYPSVKVDWPGVTPSFSGNLSGLNKLLLQGELSSIVGLNFQPTWLDGITINNNNNNTADDPTIIRAILDLNIAKIDSISVAFEKGESELSISAQEKLISIKDQFNNLIQVAERQNLSLGLIIMGATDSIGTPSFNKKLSQKRADNVKLKLQELGIAANRLNAIGLGVIDLKTTKEGARKVLFNVVYFDSSQ
jgi:outer membrane protein OmpA-like peptidoglycan-associated protein